MRTLILLRPPAHLHHLQAKEQRAKEREELKQELKLEIKAEQAGRPTLRNLRNLRNLRALRVLRTLCTLCTLHVHLRTIHAIYVPSPPLHHLRPPQELAASEYQVIIQR